MMLTMTKTSLHVILALVFTAFPAWAEDWTVNSKNYHNVTVAQVELDRVHITYDGGVGTVMLSDLTPELQKRFNYDPVAAKAAEAKREADQKAVDAQLAAEEKQQAAKAPKPPLTFEEKVEAAKQARRKQIEGEIKALTDGLENAKVQAAAHAGDIPAVQKQYANAIAHSRNQIAQLQARLDSIK